MNSKNEIFDLMSLLKVFDVNYASEDDCEVVQNLDVNNPQDISRAVNDLLLPEFRNYLPAAKIRLIEQLRSSLGRPDENFDQLFDQVQLIFEDPISDPRAFMKSLLDALASADTFAGAGPSASR